MKSLVEEEYQRAMDALTPAQRVERSAAMFVWTRDMISRQIAAEHPDLTAEQIKWHVALRLYGDEPGVRKLIERELAEISSPERG